MKLFKSLLTAVMFLAGTGVVAAKDLIEDVILPEFSVRECAEAPDYVVIDAPSMLPAIEPIGAPSLPHYNLEIALPEFAQVVDVQLTADWREVSRGVRILPVQEPRLQEPDAEIPDFVALGAEYAVMPSYPEQALSVGSVIQLAGRRILPVTLTPFRYRHAGGILECAENVRLTVAITEPPTRLRKIQSIPADAEAKDLVTNVNYLIISPNNLVNSWRWFIQERKRQHPELTYGVVNTADIYAAIPYDEAATADSPRLSDGGFQPRNPAESIHAFLRQQWNAYSNTLYVVLGGPWINAQNLSDKFYRADTGELASVDNSIPGVVSYPRYAGEDIPSDLFYACVNLKSSSTGNEQEYKWPWDSNGDGTYLLGEVNSCDLYPKFVVTRMTMKADPDNWYGKNPNGSFLSSHQLITNFVAKLDRAEAPDFNGLGKYGLNTSSLNYTKYYKNDSLMYRGEYEYYDDTYNMWDPRHPEPYVDNEMISRRRWPDIFAKVRPIIESHQLHDYNIQTRGIPSNTRGAWYAALDREFAFHFGHGWAGGSGEFGFERFATCTGLTLFSDVGLSCQTGWLDYTKNVNGVKYAKVCLGEAGVGNPKGGYIASMNNTRSGWGSFPTGTYNDGLSLTLMQRALEYFMRDNENAGNSWLKTIQSYHGSSRQNSTASWVMCTESLFGDPLIRARPVTDIEGRMPVEHEMVRHLVYGAEHGSAATIDHKTSVVDFNLTQSDDNAEFTLSGNGQLRVMMEMTVNNGDLNVTAGGGAGSGIKFLSSTPRTLTLAGGEGQTFYVGGVKGAAETVKVNGAGAVLDWELNDKHLVKSLSFNGSDRNVCTNNIVRNRTAGLLSALSTIPVRNSSVTFETHDAFGSNAFTEPRFVLDSAALTFRQNPWAGLSGYLEYIAWPLVMTNSNFAVDATADVRFGRFTGAAHQAADIRVSGQNAFVSTSRGSASIFGVNYITTAANSTLRMELPIADAGDGQWIFRGEGLIEITAANTLAGKLDVEAGTTLKLDTIPLIGVTELNMASGSTLVIPYSESGFYSILPVSSMLNIAEGVTITDHAGNVLQGTATYSGNFFQSGTLLEWHSASGNWSINVADKPWRLNGVSRGFSSDMKTYFADVYGGSATIDVSDVINAPFAYFANQNTGYTIRRKAGDEYLGASLTIDSLTSGGDLTITNLDFTVTSRLDVNGGRFFAEHPVIANVEVGAGGIFGALSLTGPGGAPTELNVAAGGALELRGGYHAEVNLATGAVLRAIPGDYFTWNLDTPVTYGSYLVIDASQLELTNEPQILIAGDHTLFTLEHLALFRINRTDAALRIDTQGRLAVVRADGLSSPYTRTLTENAATWNTSDWFANGVSFGARTWSECGLDIGGLVSIALDAANVELTLDTKVSMSDILIAPAGDVAVESFTLSAMPDKQLHTLRLDLSSLECPVTLNNIDLAGGRLLAGYAVRIVGGTGSFQQMPGSELTFDSPETSVNWTLTEGVQGLVNFTITGDWLTERRPIAKISGFNLGGTAASLKALNAQGVVLSGFNFEQEGDFLYIVPAALEAEISANSAFTTLNWCSSSGVPVVVSDWTKIAHAKLIPIVNNATVVMDAAPKQSLTIAGTASLNALNLVKSPNVDVSLPAQIAIYSPLIISGEMLPKLDVFYGPSILTLNDVGEVLGPVLTSAGWPFGNARVVLNGTTHFIFRHSVNLAQEQSDWSRLSGDGTVEVRSLTNNAWMSLPRDNGRFAATLSFVNNSDITMSHWYNGANPFTCRNLSGSGNFRADYGAKTANNLRRAIRTVQTRTTTWSGYAHQQTEGRYITLEVAGEEKSAADANKRLILTNTGGGDYAVVIAGNGAVEYRARTTSVITDEGGILAIDEKSVFPNNLKVGEYAVGQLAMLGGDYNLETLPPVLTNSFRLAAGATGSLRLPVTALNAKTRVMAVADDYSADNRNLILIAKVNGDNADSGWTDSPLVENGVLYWNGGQTMRELSNDLTISGNVNFNSLVFTDANNQQVPAANVNWRGVSRLTLKSTAAGGATIDVGDALRNFDGVLELKGGVNLMNVSDFGGTLAATPEGLIRFKVDDVNSAKTLIRLVNGATIDPGKLEVEVVGPDGLNNANWSWYFADGELRYKIVNLDSVKHGFHFDGNCNGYGSATLGCTPTTNNPNCFTASRGATLGALTNHNPYGSNFEMNCANWTLFICVRAAPAANRINWSVGSNANGLALATQGDNGMSIARWTGNRAHTDLVVADNIPDRSTRFHNYAVVYRQGYLRLYVDGQFIGGAYDLESVENLGKRNWQVFSIHGGNGSTGLGTGDAGAFDEMRFYQDALSPNAIASLNNMFAVWPEKYEPAAGETVVVNAEEIAVAGLFYGGEGTVELSGSALVPLRSAAGSSRLVIHDGVVLTTAVSGTQNSPNYALNGRDVEIEKGGRLQITYAENYAFENVDLSHTVGNGQIEFSGVSGYWIAVPMQRFASTLELVNNADMPMNENFVNTPLTVNGLSGNGNFRCDYGGTTRKQRMVRAVQTENTEWAGSLSAESRERTVALTVAGQGTTPSLLRALTLSGNETDEHSLTIEANGCVRLASPNAWKGSIKNLGLLVVSPGAGETIDLDTIKEFSESGEMFISGAGVIASSKALPYMLSPHPRGTLRFTLDENALTHIIGFCAPGFTFPCEGFEIEFVDSDGNALPNFRPRMHDGILYATSTTKMIIIYE